MHIGEWKKYDGYHEAVASFEEGSEPVARLRAVLQGDGGYENVVREANRGHMLASGGSGKNTLEAAKRLAVYQLGLLCKIA